MKVFFAEDFSQYNEEIVLTLKNLKQAEQSLVTEIETLLKFLKLTGYYSTLNPSNSIILSTDMFINFIEGLKQEDLLNTHSYF